jgi:hypothetical protein
MSLLTKGGGITKLSELLIDVDKDWAAKGISNLKEIALAMARGDLPMRGNAVIVPFQPGTIGYVCTSAGPGHPLTWAPAGGALKYYFPAWIASSYALAIVPVDHNYNKAAPLATSNAEAIDDQPGLNIRQLLPAVASVDAELVVPVDQSYNKNAPVGSDLSILVDGFVEETAAAVQTDKTAQARSAAAGDLNLCPMTPAALDKIYIGSNYPFYRVWMNYSQAGVGNWTNVAYYWNGAWVACVGEDDQTSSFLAAAGIRRIDHTPQGDWALSVIQGMNLYWMMIRTDVFVNQVTAPLGSQVFVSIA